MAEAAVLFEEIPAVSGKIGHITLNVPGTLNSLTLEMVDLLQARLDQWRDDGDIAVVYVQGSGEKAFCAGGDVQALHESAVATPGGPNTLPTYTASISALSACASRIASTMASQARLSTRRSGKRP